MKNIIENLLKNLRSRFSYFIFAREQSIQSNHLSVRTTAPQEDLYCPMQAQMSFSDISVHFSVTVTHSSPEHGDGTKRYRRGYPPHRLYRSQVIKRSSSKPAERPPVRKRVNDTDMDQERLLHDICSSMARSRCKLQEPRRI